MSRDLSNAVDALRAGQLVGMPTETVYGLAADATNPRAIAAVFGAKGRPRFNPLISHIPNLLAGEQEGVFSPLARRLAQAFLAWPSNFSGAAPARRIRV